MTLDLRAAMASASSLNFLQSAVKKSPCMLPLSSGISPPFGDTRTISIPASFRA